MPPELGRSGHDAADDGRPETSPYIASSVKLRSSEGNEFLVALPLLKRFPKLPPISPWSERLALDISHDVMHVFVHHLYTNTYQCLKPAGATKVERLEAELSIAARVYAFARAYEIVPLQELASREMEQLSQHIQLPAVLRLVQNACPGLAAEGSWFRDFVKTRLKSLLQAPSWVEVGITDEKRTISSASDLLLDCLREMVEGNVLAVVDSSVSREATIARPEDYPRRVADYSLRNLVQHRTMVEPEPAESKPVPVGVDSVEWMAVHEPVPLTPEPAASSSALDDAPVELEPVFYSSKKSKKGKKGKRSSAFDTLEADTAPLVEADTTPLLEAPTDSLLEAELAQRLESLRH